MQNVWVRPALLALVFFCHHESSAHASQSPSWVPGEYVVKIKRVSRLGPEADFQGVAKRLSAFLGKQSQVRFERFKTSGSFATFKLPLIGPDRVLKGLSRDPVVAYAEPNYLFHTFANSEITLNDPEFGSLWGMKNTGQVDSAGQSGVAGADIHVTPVWEQGVVGSRSIKVAVIDTGIDHLHPDLSENVDAAKGFSFVTQLPGAMDDHGHGTHCAGTIGAMANNGKGVIGVNWQVNLIPIKFLDSQGNGSLDRAVQAIQYATQLHVNVMSNSWGGGPYTRSLYDAIEEARKNGILFVAAAGNDSNDNDANPTYPAGYTIDNVISVAATDNQDQLAGFSNFGEHTVQVAAPGVKILSTLKGGGYGYLSGTSMAAPHVAGVAALILSVNPSMQYAELRQQLIRGSDPVRSLSHKVVSRGRINAFNSIHGVFPVVTVPDERLWQDVSFGLESPHPYENGIVSRFPFRVPGAKYVRVVFEKIETEAGFDFLRVRQNDGAIVDSLTGGADQRISEYLVGEGGEIVLSADSNINKWGFKVSKLQAIY